MANQVTLTFAGETKPAEDAFRRVGDSSDHMRDRVGDSADGFDRVGEAADGAEGKAQGFSDTLTGVADIGAGTSEIMKGNLFEGFVTVGTGMADLAGGMASFLIPALKASRIGTLATAAAQRTTAAATKAWAVAQRALSLSLLASPITWIVLAIVALIAIIVLIARRTDWFSKAWRASWRWIKDAAANVWDWLKALPGRIAGVFSKLASAITAPFRGAFNGIARAWNATIGSLQWTVPGWVPGLGGNTIGAPRLPTFHAGGTVPGVAGTPTLAMLQAGERVENVASTSSSDGGWVSIRGDAVIDALVRAIATRVDSRGGRAAQLGIRFV